MPGANEGQTPVGTHEGASIRQGTLVDTSVSAWVGGGSSASVCCCAIVTPATRHPTVSSSFFIVGFSFWRPIVYSYSLLKPSRFLPKTDYLRKESGRNFEISRQNPRPHAIFCNLKNLEKIFCHAAVLYCISDCRFAIIKTNGDERGDCCTQ